METPRLLWTPDEVTRETCNLTAYMRWVNKTFGFDIRDYQSLWQWSVDDPDTFWRSIFQYFNVVHSGSPASVTRGTMPGVRWFEGVSLNYAENIFRSFRSDRAAIIYRSETGEVREVGWPELRRMVGAVQRFLRENGVEKGDRVAGYLPCTPEATAAMLATVSIGAIWSSASPDFGTNSLIDRFQQINPKILIASDRYAYNGKTFDKSAVIRELAASLPSLSTLLIISDDATRADAGIKTVSWKDVVTGEERAPSFERVPFDHPLWVLYSSGTTGLPKPITHSHGGILLEQFKYGAFHNDFKAGERCFWYTTTGWMMWNYIHGSLLCGATMVLYDGSPGFPDLNVLWKFAEEAKITHFGTSAAFILANMKAGIRPSEKYSFAHLRSIGSTGSTLPPEGFDWIYANVKKNVWLASMSGGTDVCSAFVGGNPLWPVYAGEIQCRALGCCLEAFDETGRSVEDEVGEMVITSPMPSMPIFFWNDENSERYRESYFEMYPGVWRHGDWIRITPRKGIVIYGRSDATLNRAGIRIGTSEIYRAVDKVKDVKDSLIICIEKPGGEFWMPLFVVLQDGVTLDDGLKNRINTTIRSEYSPRHIPDEIIVVPDIPYTISGKKTETPVKKVLMGKNPAVVVNNGSLRNPSSMDFFIRLAGNKAGE